LDHGQRDDAALVTAVRAGDDRAFEALFERHHRAVTAYARSMLRDHARAEDVTQDVFVSALKRLRTTEQPIAFKAWIHEIAKNKCIDAWRRSSRADIVSIDAGESLAAADRGRLVSVAPTPDAEVDTRLELEQLKGAFEGLSDAHHEILIMRELHGYSYEEIGRRLGMTQAAVESTLFRARRRLGEEFDELGTGAACRRSRAIIAHAETGARTGARDELRLARHVAHCQPCRREAVRAGFDLAALAERKGLRAKIAGFLPLPPVLRKFLHGHQAATPSAASGADGMPLALMSAEPVVHGAGKLVAAAVAAIAVAGVGAGTATRIAHSGASDPRPNASTSAPDARSAKQASVKGTTAAERRAAAGGKAAALGSASATTTGRAGAAAKGGGSTAATAGGRAAAGGSASGAGSPSTADAAAGGSSAADAVRRSTASATDRVAGDDPGPAATTPSVSTPSVGAGSLTVPSTSVPSVTVPKPKQAVRNPTGTVSGTTGTATGAGTSATGTAQGAAHQATGSATGAANRAVPGATGAASRAVPGATGAAKGATGGTVGEVEKEADDAVGGVTATAGLGG
jgi:RNA polymerase sigma factor (sigma-70 family)